MEHNEAQLFKYLFVFSRRARCCATCGAGSRGRSVSRPCRPARLVARARSRALSCAPLLPHSLVLETLPKHKDYAQPKHAKDHARFRKARRARTRTAFSRFHAPRVRSLLRL